MEAGKGPCAPSRPWFRGVAVPGPAPGEASSIVRASRGQNNRGLSPPAAGTLQLRPVRSRMAATARITGVAEDSDCPAEEQHERQHYEQGLAQPLWHLDHEANSR